MSKTVIKHISVSVIMGFIVFVGLTAVAALIFLKVPVSQKVYLPTVIISGIAGAVISSVRSTLKTKGKGIIMGAVSSALFDVLLAVLTISLNTCMPGGKFFAVTGIIFVIGTLSGIYTANLKL